jgi:hypothetical protein
MHKWTLIWAHKGPNILPIRALLIVGAASLTQACAGPLVARENMVVLPLGSAEIRQDWTSTELEPGVVYHEVIRTGDLPPDLRWRWRSAPLLSDADIARTKSCVGEVARDLALSEQKFRLPGSKSDTYTIVHLGAYPTAAEALAVKELGSACALRPEIKYDDPLTANGPWRVMVLEIAPDRFAGELQFALANGVVAGRQTVPEIARLQGALAAVNGGFFIILERDGVVGDPSGLAVVRGELASEPINGRSAVIIENDPKLSLRFDRNPSPVTMRWADGMVTAIDGVNRASGLNRNCGNMGDEPDDRPAHDLTCTDSGELVLLNSFAGFPPPPEAMLFRIGNDGLMVPAVAGEPIEDGAMMLVATGDRQAEITARLKIADRVSVETGYEAERPDLYALTGGPLLLLDGEDVLDEAQEGWSIDASQTPARQDEVHRWVNGRNPRTAIGQRADGTILIVVIDGRQPNLSVGATITELRSVMRALGAQSALNLDGGGSTTLVVQGQLENSPSDRTGPRLVGDALLLISGKNSSGQ